MIYVALILLIIEALQVIAAFFADCANDNAEDYIADLITIVLYTIAIKGVILSL